MDGVKLKSTFFEIKERIANLEERLTEEIQELHDKNEKWNRLEEQANEIKATKGKQRVRFNIYGKRFTTTIETLLSARDSLFYQMILSNEVDLSEEIFFEVDPVMFSYVLDYLRTRVINIKRFNHDELRKLIKVAEFFEIVDLIELVEARSNPYFIKMEFKEPYIKAGIQVASNCVEDLNDPNPITGTCVSTPAWILLELNKECEFNTIHVQGYTKNVSDWSPEYGVNATIKFSLDKNKWTTFGCIPSGFGTSLKSISSTKIKAKFLKIEGTTNLGIGHIRVGNII